MSSENQDSIREMVDASVGTAATVYTHERSVYTTLNNYRSVINSSGEYVRAETHGSGMESF